MWALYTSSFQGILHQTSPFILASCLIVALYFTVDRLVATHHLLSQ